MQLEINNATTKAYFSSLQSAVDSNHDAYQLVPRWGNYVGNDANDAWTKADAALKTWPMLNPQYAAIGAYPRSAKGAVAASQALRTLAASEGGFGVTGSKDPLHVGFGGDPEQAAAFDHDFEHGVAAAAHDLRGEIAANAKFAHRSLHNAVSAGLHGDAVAYMRDANAAVFIGEGETNLDIASEAAAGRLAPPPR